MTSKSPRLLKEKMNIYTSEEFQGRDSITKSNETIDNVKAGSNFFMKTAVDFKKQLSSSKLGSPYSIRDLRTPYRESLYKQNSLTYLLFARPQLAEET